jgi:hypothetical protein
MVNDNVRYHGEEIPVDLILSDFVEQAGLVTNKIRVLPRGKGNSSQQMGKWGRMELRKCVTGGRSLDASWIVPQRRKPSLKLSGRTRRMDQ